MTLLEIYKKNNLNKDWFESHSSLAKGAFGRMFEYTNTNFRRQKAFVDQFKKFLEIENKSREEWTKQEHHKQELDKHRVVNMIQSKFFKQDTNGLYSRTAKGRSYNEFIDSEPSEAEGWLVNYIYLLNGYYTNRKNYIIYRVREDLLGHLLSVDGLTKELLVNSVKKLLETNSLQDALLCDFFYLHSFYDDSDFLISYLRSSDSEKKELADYIHKNIQTSNFVCCISKKYKPGGNFNHNMLIDESKVFLLTILFLEYKDPSPDKLFNFFVDSFDINITKIDKESVLKNLDENKEIFYPIFAEVLEIEDVEPDITDAVVDEKIVSKVGKDIAEDYIDETSESGKQEIKAIYNIRKRQARIQGGFKCALEKINNCKPVYFTAKATGKNYLELHHLIPREFRNDFSYSIEVLANYVTLCPRCHRQIHLAVDRERKHLINSLFDDRKNRLDTVGLTMDLKNIYGYYKINE